MSLRRHLASLAALAALLGLTLLLSRFPARNDSPPWLHRVQAAARSAESVDNFDLDTANYYEGLMNPDGGQLPPVLRARGWRWFRVTWIHHEKLLTVQTSGFEMHRMIPGMAVTSPAGVMRTNSFGFADKEFTKQKPAGTLRIALIGDSVVRALGAPFGTAFESQLEDYLNQTHTTPEIRRFEVLNFGVSRYMFTQFIAVAEEQAAEFSPDVYIVALTRQHVAPLQWADHLTQLVQARRDLRYPFLRELAQRAGLTAADSHASAREKMAPFYAEALRLSLREIDKFARSRGARMMVVLLPVVERTPRVQNDFRETRRLLAGEFEVVDLSDTFQQQPDLMALRIAPDDFHPNARGHELLCRNLVAQTDTNPRLRAILLGLSRHDGSAAAHSEEPGAQAQRRSAVP
ncbi:MAG TPA: SGNH/GDSL hydrolase family protein [Candidatus Nitrosotenuis sp.]|nr:SGNH/GDSL hydrolase family protein [Candidatus Nitrosotenuis sp.]